MIPRFCRAREVRNGAREVAFAEEQLADSAVCFPGKRIDAERFQGSHLRFLFLGLLLELYGADEVWLRQLLIKC